MLIWELHNEVKDTLAKQGFIALPILPGEKGTKGTFRWRGYNRPGAPHPSEQVRDQWKKRLESLHSKDVEGFEENLVGSYILPSSGKRFFYVVVDVDNPECEKKALEDFGLTPLCVTRGGRIRHRYYISKIPVSTHTQLYGRGTVDVVGSTGAVLPGSIHKDGEVYDLSISFEQWTEKWVLENVPFFNHERFVEIKSAKKSVAQELAEYPAPPEGALEGFIHTKKPVERRGSLWCGWVHPATQIILEDGHTKKAICELGPGERVFATYRADSRPSAEVSDFKGRRRFWDWSTTPPRQWTMLEPQEGENDPFFTASTPEKYFEELPEVLERTLGIGVRLLPSVGWVSDHLGALEEHTTTFLIAPHGTGKTIVARSEHEKASSSISVCNTQALTISNASVLNLKAIYEGIEQEEPHASVCIPSIVRYMKAPEFFHVDEADAVHCFLHSGKVKAPLACWEKLINFATYSRRCLIASADLLYEDVALFVQEIRKIDPCRHIVCAVRVPESKKQKVRLVPSKTAKAAIHEALSEENRKPLFVGLTARKLAGEIAHGYQTVSRKRTALIDDENVIPESLETPSPKAVAQVMVDLSEESGEDLQIFHDTAVENSFFVSGENNRFTETVKWLEDTDYLVNSHDLVVMTPAVQSGVSLVPAIQKVIVLHEFREVPANTVIQIARRARNVLDDEILVGMKNWTPIETRTDKVFLMDMLKAKNECTLRAFAARFPSAFMSEHETEEHEGFLLSWRIFIRRNLESSANPLGQLKTVCRRQKFEVLDQTGAVTKDTQASKSFQRIVKHAGKYRNKKYAHFVAIAPDISEEEVDEIEKKPVLQSGEKTKLLKARIKEFYGVENVSHDLVLLDNGGKYRKKIILFSHVLRVFEGEGDQVLYGDHRRNKGRQKSQTQNKYIQALLMHDLMVFTIGGEYLEGGVFEVHKVREKVRVWWDENYAKMNVFFPKIFSPKESLEAQWLGYRLRSLGAEIKNAGGSAQRKSFFSFSLVRNYAPCYLQKMEKGNRMLKAETWRVSWKT